MSEQVTPRSVDVLQVVLDTEAFDDDQVVVGTPDSGWLPVADLAGVEVGVWQMTPGVITDIEADEIFCVIAGSGMVEFLDPAADPVELRPGVLVRLHAGWRTRWTIAQTLRKIAVVPGEVDQK